MLRGRKSRAGHGEWRHFLESLEPRTLLSADLSVSIVKINTPDILVPGDKISVNVKITNVGTDTATGALTSGVYASLNTTWDASDILLGSAEKNINIRPLRSITLAGSLPINSAVLPGTYYLVVKDTSDLTSPDTDALNDEAASDVPREVAWEFGNVGSRKNVKMKVEYKNETPVTFALTGAGTGQIINPDEPIEDLNVGVMDSTYSSNLNITTPARTTTEINSITINGSINRIAAASTSIGAGIEVKGFARTIIINDIDAPAHFIDLNTDALVALVSTKVDITAHSMTNCNVDTGGIPIGTLKAFQATDLRIVAPTVQKLTLTATKNDDFALKGMLTIDQGGAVVPATASVNITAGKIENCTLDTGDLPIGSLTAYQAADLNLMAPSMQSMNVTDKVLDDTGLSGTVILTGNYGTHGLALGKLAVSAGIADLTLVLSGGGANSISCRSWDGGSLTVNGTVSSLAVTKSMDGDVNGNVTKAKIGGDYTGAWAGTFDALTVKGWMSNATISASDPVGSITLGGMRNSAITIGANVALPGLRSQFEASHAGTIKSLTVTGMKVSGHNVASFINSDIAAWQITTLKLAFADTNNSGTPFGAATTFVKTFTYKPLTGLTRTGSNLTPADSFTDGDFVLRIL
jgi:hypothetical protein